jgi:hypothetical protein
MFNSPTAVTDLQYVRINRSRQLVNVTLLDRFEGPSPSPNGMKLYQALSSSALLEGLPLSIRFV